MLEAISDDEGFDDPSSVPEQASNDELKKPLSKREKMLAAKLAELGENPDELFDSDSNKAPKDDKPMIVGNENLADK